MGVAQQGVFRTKYGNMLLLLEIKVLVPAIMALVQYYDVPLRCFTFQSFQLMHTLEEYE